MNFGMFGLKQQNGDDLTSGLLELNLGGGSLFTIGTGGTDISYGTLLSAQRGLDAFTKNIEINRMVKDRDLRAGMRTLYSYGEKETSALYDDVIAGRASFTTGNDQGYEGYTTLDGNGKRIIDLNTSGKSRLDLAVLMSHEAYRDGEVGEFGEQQQETRKAVENHMGVSYALQRDYGVGYLSDSNNFEAKLYKLHEEKKITDQFLKDYVDQRYRSDGEYWKLMDDGSIVWDGSKDLTDENDNIIRKFLGEGGNTAALADHLGVSEDEARQLIVSTGIDDYKNGTFVDSDGNDVKLDKNFAIGMYNQFVRDGVAIPYGDIYNSRVITDSTTGMTGTIFDHNPVNIYNSLVDAGQMVNPQYEALYNAVGADIADATFDSPNISYEDWKENN